MLVEGFTVTAGAIYILSCALYMPSIAFETMSSGELFEDHIQWFWFDEFGAFRLPL